MESEKKRMTEAVPESVKKIVVESEHYDKINAENQAAEQAAREAAKLEAARKRGYRITPAHRKRLAYYLKEFYKRYPGEKHTVFHFVRFFKSRLKKNKDAWMAVSGDTSVGKSYFVILAMVLFGRPMKMNENIAYVPTGSQIMDMFDKLNFQTLLIDEAAREMRAVNWQSKQQQGVNVRAMTDRFKNNWVFLNMPNFTEFTKSMRVGNLQFRAIMPYRTDTHARVFIQRKSRNWRSPDPWGDENMMKKYSKAERRYKELSNETILKLERSCPNTVMDFMVPNLALILPDVVEEYERLKLESRKERNVEEGKTGVDKSKHWKGKYESAMSKAAKLLLYNPLGIGKVKVTKLELAKSLGISPALLNKYLAMEDREAKEQFKASRGQE